MNISTNTVDIVEFEFVKRNIVEKLEFTVMELKLHEHVKVLCLFKDKYGNVLNNQIVLIDGQDYKNWGSNDDYLVNIVLQKLNIVKK